MFPVGCSPTSSRSSPFDIPCTVSIQPLGLVNDFDSWPAVDYEWYMFSGVGGVSFLSSGIAGPGFCAWNWSIVLGFSRQFFATGLPLQLGG